MPPVASASGGFFVRNVVRDLRRKGRSGHSRCWPCRFAGIDESREPVDQFRLGEPQSQYPSLRTIKAGAGDRDPMVEAGGKMTEQRAAGTADIRLGQAVVQLRLGGKRMQEFVLLLADIMAIKVEEVVNA